MVAQNTKPGIRRDPFQAVADPTRRAILILIAAHAMTPTALAGHFDVTRQAVSKHIRILEECDVVERQRAGRETYYQVKPDRMAEIDRWLEQFRQSWEDRFIQLDRVLTNLKSKRNEK